VGPHQGRGLGYERLGRRRPGDVPRRAREAGWAVRKSVAGARQQTTVLGDPHKTLREAKAAVQGDWERWVF
jgi:hypothetical protein